MTAIDADLSALDWKPDILGPGYEQAVLQLGEDPDTGKDVRAVLVRAAAGNAKADPRKPALLWIHGLSDYFFQDHVAEYFTGLGYPCLLYTSDAADE